MPINPNMILSVGTKIVVLEDIKRKDEIALHQGAVGVIIQSPKDNTHTCPNAPIMKKPMCF